MILYYTIFNFDDLFTPKIPPIDAAKVIITKRISDISVNCSLTNAPTTVIKINIYNRL